MEDYTVVYLYVMFERETDRQRQRETHTQRHKL